MSSVLVVAGTMIRIMAGMAAMATVWFLPVTPLRL